MRVVAYLPYACNYGGGEKHGLTLLGCLPDRVRATVLYEDAGPDRRFDPAVIRERFGLDPERFDFERVPGAWAVPGRVGRADLFVSLMGSRVLRTRAVRHLALLTFPDPPSDDRPIGVGGWAGWAWQRAQERYHAVLDRLDPQLFDTPTAAYLRRHGTTGAWRSVPLVALRKAGRRRACDRYYLGRESVAGFDVVAANSQYTARWIRRYYGVKAAINYPPIDTPQFRPGPKERVILSVGRFHPEPTSKKFHVLVDVFRRLVESGVAARWRLVLAGGATGSNCERYLTELRRQASGLPVEFAVNRPLPELTDLYARAGVYWHAMGYGEDPEIHPARYEHFGMSTVEAMAAGCVPMVVNGGGQPEIVTEGVHGYLWDTPADLAEAFTRLVRLPAETVAAMRDRAVARADDFGPAAYRRNTTALFERLGVPADGG